ncbi:MAG: terminase gpA endonuclease subunit, partial [Planctomycetota bacterium JB042]
NEPLVDEGLAAAGLMAADDIASKLNGHAEGVVPVGASRLTAFIDVQQRLLYWVVVAWGEGFSGYVVAYGAWPDQRRHYFSLADAQHTLAEAAPGAGLEGSVFAGIDALTRHLLGKEWIGDAGTPMRIELCMVDASWGRTTDVVYQVCRQSPHGAILLPSHGRYVSPAARAISDFEKKPGDRVGLEWRIPGNKGKRAVRHAIYDTNWWKTFVHSRLEQAMGDPGCLSLFGRDQTRHRMLAEHLTAETRQRLKGSKRTADIWALRPGVRDNHLLDCVVGCAVGASVLGVALAGMEPAGQAKKRRRVSLSELQRLRRTGR